jgi:hypothetical protein
LKYIPVTLQYPKGSKLSPEYEKLETIKGKGYKDYNEIVSEDYEKARKKTTIEIADLEDENNNQIPDKAEMTESDERIKEAMKD